MPQAATTLVASYARRLSIADLLEESELGAAPIHTQLEGKSNELVVAAVLFINNVVSATVPFAGSEDAVKLYSCPSVKFTTWFGTSKEHVTQFKELVVIVV